MTKIRWGVFGTGLMARRFAADIKLSQTGVLVAVASRNPQRAQAFAPDVTPMESYEALALSDAVDAIYVATPNATHRDLCILALRGGKGVLCEKPIATHPDDLRAIMVEAEKAGRICLEGIWTLFLPGLAACHRRITQGEIGEVLHAHASLGFGRMEQKGDPITDPTLGGGATYDLGVYCVSVLNHLLGPCTLSHHTVARSASGSVRNAMAVLQHNTPTGTQASSSIAISHDAVLPNRIDITGTRGRIEIESPFIQVQAAKMWPFKIAPYSETKSPSATLTKIKSLKYWPKARNLLKSALGRGGASLPCDYAGSGFQFQIDEVGACMAQDRRSSAILPLQNSLNTLELIHKISSF